MDNQSSRRLLALFVQLLNGQQVDFNQWQQLNPSDKPKSERVFHRDLAVIRDTLHAFDTGYEVVLRHRTYHLDAQQVVENTTDFKNHA